VIKLDIPRIDYVLYISWEHTRPKICVQKAMQVRLGKYIKPKVSSLLTFSCHRLLETPDTIKVVLFGVHIVRTMTTVTFKVKFPPIHRSKTRGRRCVYDRHLQAVVAFSEKWPIFKTYDEILDEIFIRTWLIGLCLLQNRQREGVMSDFKTLS